MAAMSWQSVALVALGTVQTVSLAWVAAWQRRAATLVKQTNGQVDRIEAGLAHHLYGMDARSGEEHVAGAPMSTRLPHVD